MSSPSPSASEAVRERKDIFDKLEVIQGGKKGAPSFGAGSSGIGSPAHSQKCGTHPFASTLPPTTPNTRRLPPIFQEHRLHGAAIQRACAGLEDTLFHLDSEFSGRVTWTTLAAFISSVHGSVGRMTGSDTLSFSTNSRGRQSRGGTSGHTVYTSAGLLVTRYPEDVARVRTAAADEGQEDDQSVSDYAAEPVIPHFAQGDVIRNDVLALEPSLRKILDGVGQMCSIECKDSGNPWWQSAMLTRDMKALAIRINYHARNALLWNNRARERLLVSAVSANQHSEKSRADLIYMREQQELFSARIDSSILAQTEATAEMEKLQATLREVKEKRGEMQRALVNRTHELGLLPRGMDDPARAELLLLLEQIAWPPTLAQDVERVAAWTRERPMFADV